MSFNIEVEGGTSVQLPTAGKYCDRDIVITATGGSGGGGEVNTGTCTVVIVPVSKTNHYIARETVATDGSITYTLSKSYTGDAISVKARCDSVLYCLVNIKTATATGGELLRVQSGQGVAFKTPSEDGASVEITLGS